MAPWTLGRREQTSKKTAEGDGSSANALVVSNSDDQLELDAKPVIFESDPTEGKYSLKILHHPDSAAVDIVFVHGLTGNRETTWTRNVGKRNSCFWPQDLLSDNETGIPNARIATWGYDADVVNKRPLAVVSTNTIEQHATNLCTDLANARKGEKTGRPLIFVVHSLGGLVVKTALLYANESRTQSMAHVAAVVDSTIGVLFMGTPHRGSEQARWGGILASVLGYVKQDNAELVKRLNKEEPRLALLQERFANLLEMRKEVARPIGIVCFYEELPVPVLGTIVPAPSAEMAPYPAVGIHANHMDMTKFGGDDSAGYIKTLNELRRLIENVKSMRESSKTSDATNWQAKSTESGGGINFYGSITGEKVVAGTQTTGGTTNFTFN